MSIRFSADEILALAEQIERNGAAFYRKAAESIRDEKNRQSLLDLAGMEDHHVEVFADMRAGLTDKEKEPTAYDPDDEGALYLQAMAGGYVFNVKDNPADALTGKESFTDILHLAIGKEKDSIVFYLGLKKIVPEKLGKDRVDAIIKEEISHIALLSKALAAA